MWTPLPVMLLLVEYALTRRDKLAPSKSALEALPVQALYKELDRRRPTAGRADSSAETADSTGRSSAAAPHAGGQQAETAARPPAGGQDAAGREPTAPDAAHAVQAGSANSPSGRPPAVHWWDQPPADQVRSSSETSLRLDCKLVIKVMNRRMLLLSGAR